ncbi:glutathione S-transferase family protein [Roseococcus sp. SDR]|uniref:glutathione S-transferase family protein n=1 Tax=Roseococcus sp. SDR TaxID=2835532 RepID=UPI001BD195F4|nr:glutathione S-transferase family protein [Roseococcus sp. SDR]MBS7791859.1 glutathione S-transferase family protein [Roseococcus sp. SDR]MBV1847173.1 glutathione S-transferase family protein [Roseococcus sp. SDR]
MIRIHGTPKSRAFRCIWAAEEAGQPYEVVPTGFGPGIKSPAHLRVNPNGKIPAMEDGALVLFESLAINLHIAAKAGAPLMPAGDDASRALQWTLWAATEAEPAAMQWAYNTYIRPPEERDPGQAAAGAAGLNARLDVLEGQLGANPWLLGEAFTIADCNLGGVLYGAWANKFDFGGHTRVKAWLERCFNRPAALAARALRDAA